MFPRKALMAAPVMALLLSGTAASALTADQVWADWQAWASANGGKLSAATEVKDDTGLTLNGVSLGSPSGGDAVTISEVMLVEEEDGSVTVYPADITLPSAADGSKPATVTHTDLYISVHEDEGGLGYGIGATVLDVVFDVPGATEGAKVAGKAHLEELDGRYEYGAAAMGLSLSATKLAYDFTQTDPSIGMNQAQTSDTADLSIEGELTLPPGLDLMTLNTPQAFFAAARAGLGLTLAASQGASVGTLDDQNPMLPMKLSFASQPGETAVVMNKDVFQFDTSVSGLEISVLPPMVPAAVKATADGMAIGMGMPVVATDAGDYRLSMALSNLVVDEGGWAMIDPTGAFAHDPADLVVDLGGKLKIDMLDLMESQENGTAPKSMPELMTLDLKSIGASLAGAALSGTGAFTFDNSAVAAGGPPMPIGIADFTLEGGNALIDGLIKAGIITEEDATGARMMMAMFGKPGEGADVLTSQVEAKEGGQIFVNGQRVQ